MIKGIIVIGLIVFAVLIFGAPLFYFFIASPFRVSGDSMSPTLTDQEYVLIEKFSYKMGDPKRGDIILSKNPQHKDQMMIKRIIGLPKDRIRITGGFVYSNNDPLKEPYIADYIYTRGDQYQREGEEVQVPENSYYVLGDNRDRYQDSRSFGFIKRSDILGKYWFKYY